VTYVREIRPSSDPKNFAAVAGGEATGSSERRSDERERRSQRPSERDERRKINIDVNQSDERSNKDKRSNNKKRAEGAYASQQSNKIKKKMGRRAKKAPVRCVLMLLLRCKYFMAALAAVVCVGRISSPSSRCC